MCEGSLNSTLGHGAVRIHMNAKLQLSAAERNTIIIIIIIIIIIVVVVITIHCVSTQGVPKFQNVIIWVILNKNAISSHDQLSIYIANSILKFQDDVRCCTASVLIMNQLHSYSSLWKTLFPYTSHYFSKSICKYDTCSTVNRVSVHKEKWWN